MSALAKQIGVIHALFVRDALARFGHENLGFFWVIVEPLMFTTGIMVLWNIGHTNSIPSKWEVSAERIPFNFEFEHFLFFPRTFRMTITGIR